MTILPKQNYVPKDIPEDQSDDIDLDNSINDNMEEEILDLVDDDSDQSYLENENKIKNEGVKKVFVIAAVAGVKESYANIKTLFSLLNLDELPNY